VTLTPDWPPRAPGTVLSAHALGDKSLRLVDRIALGDRKDVSIARNVNATLEWPARSETTLGWTLALSSSGWPRSGLGALRSSASAVVKLSAWRDCALELAELPSYSVAILRIALSVQYLLCN
jgi:hypothetical protein